MPTGIYKRTPEMYLTRKGRRLSPNGEFKKGMIPWNYKGDKVGYYALHTWIRKKLGRASHCSNPQCIYPRIDQKGKIMLKPKRYEWANKSGKYSRDFSDWIPLCVSCHKKYDELNVKHKGNSLVKSIMRNSEMEAKNLH